MRRLGGIASLLLVFGALPAFPATVGTSISFAESEFLTESVTETLSQTFTLLSFQAFGVVGMLRAVRISGGSVSSGFGSLPFGGAITQPSLVSLFLSADGNVIRNWSIDVSLGGIGEADRDVEYDYIPGPKPAPLFLIALGLLGLFVLLRRRRAAARSERTGLGVSVRPRSS
jgi:hypothetical protein